MGYITNFADDISNITTRKRVRNLRRYLVKWPCGSTWNFDRRDLDIPEFRNGEQSGLTWCFTSVGEVIDYLQDHAGCTVEIIKEGASA